jgi:hypothetical protein
MKTSVKSVKIRVNSCPLVVSVLGCGSAALCPSVVESLLVEAFLVLSSVFRSVPIPPHSWFIPLGLFLPGYAIDVQISIAHSIRMPTQRRQRPRLVRRTARATEPPRPVMISPAR